jgi:rhamnosyltransferase
MITKTGQSGYGDIAIDNREETEYQTADERYRISLVIPTLNAADCIEELLRKLLFQTRVPDEILVVDSSSTDGTAEIVQRVSESDSRISLKVIERKNFDHGGTRDDAFRKWTTGDFVLFMTQDAVPADDEYIERLLKPFDDPRIAVVSGRQLPKSDARPFERLVRQYNYPAISFTRGKEDIQTYGIKTFYTTDVCSAYRRTAFLECGGFPRPCNMSEDMYMAAKLVAAGYLVAYAADACVYHSHNLLPSQQYSRNYAIGAFLENNKEILMGASEVGEGAKLVKSVSAELVRTRQLGELFAFGLDCAARLLGNRAGRRDARKAEKGR